ncbi:MAG: glycosyltransferase family 2 protein [Cyclobacteriaceae bacterium]
MKISVIIPTLNESLYIGETLDKLTEHITGGDRPEIIVLDSGSRDQTMDIVGKYPHVDLYSHPELKGQKFRILNQGADYATCEIFLFLDADTIVPKGYNQLIVETVAAGFVGGAFEFRLDKRSPSLKLVEIINRARYRLGQRYYGDQGIFCTRDVFYEVDGYPPKPIMESAAFCAKLRKKGRLQLIRKEAITSSRRFTENSRGPLWVLAKDIWIFFLDKIGFSNQEIAEKYWKSNDRTPLE